MSLTVNTNVSSLTAQRALAYADSLQGEAMQRLSTGSKINSASDDAAGLAIAQRMTAQVNGLNMAVKNANDGIALTQSIEGALVEVSDMLQRLRELSVQAANDTNTGIDRKAIQEEVDLLIAEISRVSQNTRYNDMRVLDGTFINKQIQVGALGGETISVSNDSVSSDQLGAYSITGDIINASLGTGAGVVTNATTAADDLIINGQNVSKTIDVALKDSAKAVATKINDVSGETGVTAVGKTYGLLASESDVDVTVSLKINGASTGEFVISRKSVADAVNAINNTSGSTGVTAQATADNKVRLYSSEGEDILVENTSSDTSLRIQTLGHDGAAEVTQRYWNRATAASTAVGTHSGSTDALTAQQDLGAKNGAYTLVRRSDGQTFSFNLAATTNGQATAAEIKTAINGISGIDGFEVKSKDDSVDTTMIVTSTAAFGDFDIYFGGDVEDDTMRQTFDGIGSVVTWTGGAGAANPAGYILSNTTTGETHTFNVAESTANGFMEAAELESALNGISGVSGFTVTTDPSTASAESTTMAIAGASITANTSALTSFGALSQIENVDLLTAHTGATATGATAGDAITIDFGGETQVTYTVVTSGNTDAANNYIAVDASESDLHTALSTILTAEGVGYSVAKNASDNTSDFTFTATGAITGNLEISVAGAADLTATVAQTGKAADTITFSGQGESIAIDVVASGATGAQVNSGDDMDALAAAFEANKSSGSDLSFAANSSGELVITNSTNGNRTDLVAGDLTFSVHSGAVTPTVTQGNPSNFVIHGSADFGAFDILSAAGAALSGAEGTTAVTQAGDLNLLDVALAAGNSADDAATIQGTVRLSSSDLFTVTQRSEETATNALTGVSDSAPSNSSTATGSLGNDNYFTTQAATLNTVSNIDLRTQVGASDALAIIDGAIEKVSSMRSSLGAVENRLDHTVNNLMNISEKTESARSRIQDADFAAESAKLSKAQVLKQAGVGMLAQANASSQLVLQLLQ